MREKPRTLDYGSRWIRDGLNESGHAGGIGSIEVDVSGATRILDQLKASGRPITWTHIFVRAVAMALSRNPDLHKMVAGNQSLSPSTVDLCLSVAGDSSVTPVIIIEDAAAKDLFAIGAEVTRRLPEATRETEKLFGVLRKWGWLVPFSALRRVLIRSLMRQLWYRRKVSGTFQVTCVPQLDIATPLLFNTCAALGIGRIRERVVAEKGQAVVRPMVTLTCCLDHSVWNGLAAARFLAAVRQVLETGDFAPAAIASGESRQVQSLRLTAKAS